MMNAVKRKKVLKDAVREREIEKLTAYIGHKGTASWFSYFLSTVRNKGVLDIKSFLSEQNSTNAIICLEAVLSDAFGGNEGYTVGYWDHLVSMKPIRHLSKIIAYSEIMWKNTEWLDALHEDFSSERGRLAAQSAVIPGVKHWLEFFFEFRDSVCDFNELETCYNILCNLEKQLYSLMNAVYPSVSMEKPLSLNALPSSDFINLIETSDLYVRVIKCINEVINRIFERIASERTRKNSLSSYYIPARCFDIYERIRAYHPGIEAFVKYQQTSDNDMFKSGSTQFENKKRAMGFCHTDKVYDYREAFEKEYSRLRENRLVNTVSSYSPYRSSRRRVCDYDDVIRYAKNGLPLGVDDSLISDASFRSRSNRKYDLDNPEDLRAFDSDVYSLHKRIESEIEKKEKRRTEIEEFDEWLWYHR